jgi:hypothetical protein
MLQCSTSTFANLLDSSTSLILGLSLLAAHYLFDSFNNIVIPHKIFLAPAAKAQQLADRCGAKTVASENKQMTAMGEHARPPLTLLQTKSLN